LASHKVCLFLLIKKKCCQAFKKITTLLFNTRLFLILYSHVSKNLDPAFDEEIELSLKSSSISIGALLYLVVVDHDHFTDDDFMCGTSLNIFEMLEMVPGERSKTVSLEKSLTVDGVKSGEIRFQLHVHVGDSQESTGETIKEIRRHSTQTYNVGRLLSGSNEQFPNSLPLTTFKREATI